MFEIQLNCDFDKIYKHREWEKVSTIVVDNLDNYQTFTSPPRLASNKKSPTRLAVANMIRPPARSRNTQANQDYQTQ